MLVWRFYLPVIETAVEFWTPEVDEAKDKNDAHKSEDWTKRKNQS